ncbi:hypothetical protein LKM00_27665 [Bacillus wiedmannii]|uniref:hypothetical protein n=1 Tax=Bacillus wiedmannii TaxID=1890302 RepID=UPI001E2F18A9|nr:hypothetical protein [Bacillus wiedmannii]MCC2381174.1 hypothetical protein [Bacillus wiedmannii]MCC2425505.1 hypothetical protein [Bacillus wiedmannii]
MSMLNEFLVDRQKQKEQEKEEMKLKGKEHFEYVKSLYQFVKKQLKDTEEKGLVKVYTMDNARTSKELAGFITEFSNEKIFFVPVKIDYKTDDQIKVIFRNTDYNLIENVYLFISKGEWHLFDNRPNRLINTHLDKENFESLLISLLEK